MGGKNITKIAMVINSLVVLGFNIGYLLLQKDIMPVDKQFSVLIMALTVSGIFTPVFLNIAKDKMKKTIDEKLSIGEK